VKKPNGKAEAGWYDAPEIDGYLQYWNGKYWTKKKQPKDGHENLDITPEYELGKFYFRKPYFSDNAFMGWVVVNFFMTISRLANNVNNGELNVSSTFSIVSGLADAVIGTLLTAFFIWIFFLAYLVPRRIKDNKKKKRK
jgi:hypothetical protein